MSVRCVTGMERLQVGVGWECIWWGKEYSTSIYTHLDARHSYVQQVGLGLITSCAVTCRSFIIETFLYTVRVGWTPNNREYLFCLSKNQSLNAWLKTLAVILKQINPAKPKIRPIFGLAVLCREFEFSAKLRLTGKFSAKIQIALNNFITDIAHCSAVSADYLRNVIITHIAVVINITVNINVTVRKAACIIVTHETMNFLNWDVRPLAISAVLNMHSTGTEAADEDKWSWASLYSSGIGLYSAEFLPNFFCG